MNNRLPESFVSPGTRRTAVSEAAGTDYEAQLNKLTREVEQLVRNNPVASLATAVFIGASLAWLLKRR